MANLTSAEWENFSDGVITAAEPELLPLSASPRGRNSALTRIAPGLAVVGNRRGIREVNPVSITGSPFPPAIIGQVDFKSYSAPTYTSYHLLVCSNGRLEYRDAATTTAAWDAALAAPFTSSTSPFLYPDFSIANNCAFICNGTSGENKKAYIESGTRKVRNWGITRPTVGSMAGAAGAAGLHNGTYELRVTYRNTRTGVESSASNTASATVNVTNQQIDWSNIPVSSDGQVDQRRLWVRNTATQANFYLAGTVNDNSTTTASTNIADSSLAVAAPDTAENDPPPTFSVAEWHGSRMFGAGPGAPTTVYYSQLGNPEAFDPEFFEFANPNDGQRITALHSAHGVLLIFKRESTWVLIGDDPNSWEIRPLFADIGAVSHRTVLTINDITYWWSEQGPMAWDGASAQPRAIGLGLLAEATNPASYNAAQFPGAAAVADLANQRVLFALPESGQSRNTLILPFNYLLQRWDADRWEVIDVASFGVVDDSSSTPLVFIGSYSGQLFEWWSGFVDGTPGGVIYTGEPDGGSADTLFDNEGDFPQTGNRLTDRYVYAISPAGTIQRRRITTNTDQQLTVTPNWTNIPVNGYTYVVGGIDFQWDTSAHTFGQAFARKRLRHLFLLTRCSAATTIHADLMVDAASTARRTWQLLLNPGGALYGTGVYGTDAYGSARSVPLRTRIGLVAREIRLRIRQLAAGKDLTLLKVAVTGEVIGDELGVGDGGTVV